MKRSLLVVVLLSLLMVLTFAQPVVKSATDLTTIFFEPDAGEAPFLSLINGAKSSLKVEVYVMTARDVFTAVKKAVDRGVNVEVILTHHPYNMQAQADYAYAYLKSIGVKVRWAPDRFSYDHAKFLIADNAKAIFGTSNLTYSGISQNFEANVLTKDETIVKALIGVFEADWNDNRAGSVPREYLVLSPNSANDFEWLINHAQRSLKICEEEVPEGEMFDVIQAAAKRGVKVQLIEPYSNVKYGSSLYTLSRLKDAGVEVRTVKSPFIHAKMIIADDTYLFIGSENVSYTSLYKNREVGIFLSNKELISQATKRFDVLWSAASTISSKNARPTIAFLPQIVAHPYEYMNKLVKTVGTVEAVFGKNIFVSYAQGNKIAGVMLWLGHVSEIPALMPGDTIRIVGGVSTYKGQLEISVVAPPTVISHALLPLPAEINMDKVKDYNSLVVFVKGTFRLSNDGAYLSDGKQEFKLVTLEGNLPKLPSGTQVYVKAIVMNYNGETSLVPLDFYTANVYVPVLEKNAVKSNPSLSELRKAPQLYYAQTITSTGIVSAVVSPSNAYIYSNGYGIRIYGKHGKIKDGDILEVKGTFTSYNNSFEIEISSLKILGHTSAVKPIKVKAKELSNYPEVLIEIEGVVSKAEKNSFYLQDESGKAYVYIPKGKVPINDQKIKVIGISVRYKDIYEVYALKIEKN